MLHDAERWAPPVHDALQFCKGPSLGCDFTLICPFTQLAHYHELVWAKEQGVSPWLLRVSVGCEDPQVIIERFSAAFAEVFTGQGADDNFNADTHDSADIGGAGTETDGYAATSSATVEREACFAVFCSFLFKSSHLINLGAPYDLC